MGAVLLGIYRLFSWVIFIIVFPFSFRRRDYAGSIWHGRMGNMNSRGEVDIWVHAASIGEVKVARNLISHILATRQKTKMHLSVMTPMGFASAKALLPSAVSVSFLMLDAPVPVSRGLNALTPKVFVFTETEIWPNLIEELHRRDIPIILVNARMSAKTFRWYRLIKPLTRRLFVRYTRFHYRTAVDASKYEALGAPQSSGVVTGDMKFDAPPHLIDHISLAKYRQRLRRSAGEKVLIAGSTRPGEEEQLLAAFVGIRQSVPQSRLVIAPRHVQRTSEVISLVNRMGLSSETWSGASRQSDVIIVDKVGLLNDLYAASDIAFVGGTLVEIGGHNLLEPVWAGIPVLFGPHIANVGEAAAFIGEANVGAQVSDKDELSRTVTDFFNGNVAFSAPENVDAGHSATHLTGTYILSKLSDD